MAPPDPAPTPDPTRSRRRFELWLAIGLVGFGLLVLPALIYVTGTVLLGAYGGGDHIGSFYGDYFRDLAATPVTWVLVLGPYVLVQLVRLLFRNRAPEADEPAEPTRPPHPATRERREPTLKL